MQPSFDVNPTPLTSHRYVFMELATGGDLLSFLKQRTQIED